MAIRFDVVRTINNPSLRVDGGLLRRLPIEVDEHFIFHIEYLFSFDQCILRILAFSSVYMRCPSVYMESASVCCVERNS
jgi:hypothetical protein